MTVSKTMNTGVTGLLAHTEALSVTGDNIANVNTVGFKYARSQFEDILGNVSARWMKAGGAGVHMVRAQQIFTQGALINTGVPTDLALSGDGFFVVKGSIDGVTGQFFSRNGQMTMRNDGAVVNMQGLELQGYTATPNGGFSSSLDSIVVSTNTVPPNPTSQIQVTANLDANEQVPADVAGNPLAWDASDPVNTSNFSTSVTVYDSLGNGHVADVYFRCADPATNTWEWHAISDPSEGAPAPDGEWASGTMTFDNSGALTGVTGSPGTVNFTGANPLTVNFEFGQNPAGGGGLTQYGSESNVSAQSQDGYAAGEISGININTDGIVSGVYSNGETLAIARIAVAKFPSNNGMGRFGHNLWIQTPDSGEPTIGGAGTDGRAAVVSGSIEQSNVDLASQFVDMITYQRAFSANAKTITTADEMLMEMVNLKR